MKGGKSRSKKMERMVRQGMQRGSRKMRPQNYTNKSTNVNRTWFYRIRGGRDSKRKRNEWN